MAKRCCWVYFPHRHGRSQNHGLSLVLITATSLPGLITLLVSPCFIAKPYHPRMHCQGPGSCLPSFQWHGLSSFGAWLPPPNSPLWSSLVLTTAIIVFLAVLCERRTFGEPPHGCWERSPSLLPWVMCTRLPAGRQPGLELLADVLRFARESQPKSR